MLSRKVTTLVLILEKHGTEPVRRVLLGMKKRGFGVGKWNGFGGKVESNETVMEGAVRELHEECGITPVGLRETGLLAFDFPDGSCCPLLVRVFVASEYEGDITESEEMRPQWFDTTDIPFGEMWEDDHLWFPMILSNTPRPFVGTLVFKEVHTMIEHTVSELREDQSFDELARTI